jgi:hypothetical protein
MAKRITTWLPEERRRTGRPEMKRESEGERGMKQKNFNT